MAVPLPPVSVDAPLGPKWAWLHAGSYLLVLGPPDVRGVGLCPGAGHSTEVAVQLRLHPPWAAIGLDPHLLSCLFLLVLLSFQVLTVRLLAESEGGLIGVCPPSIMSPQCPEL